MRNLKHILLLVLLLAAGAMVTAMYDWNQSRRALDAEATRAAERLVGLLSLYPLHSADADTHRLLAKALVEAPQLR